MKRALILSLFFLLLMGSWKSAQSQQGRPAISVDTLAARETYFLAHHLKLSKEQRVKVFGITRVNIVQMDSVRKLSLDPRVKSNTLGKLAREYRAALKGLFSPVQYTVYEALIAEQRKKFEARAKNVKELPQ